MCDLLFYQETLFNYWPSRLREILCIVSNIVTHETCVMFWKLFGVLLLKYMVCLITWIFPLEASTIWNTCITCTFISLFPFRDREKAIWSNDWVILPHVLLRDKLFFMVYFKIDIFVQILSSGSNISYMMYLTCEIIIDLNFS